MAAHQKRDSIKLLVEDRKNKNNLELTVDWKNRKKGRYIKAQMGNLKAELNKDQLWKAIFTIVEEHKQEMMIPTERIDTKHFSKWITVKATKNIKKGENIVFKTEFTISEEDAKAILRGELSDGDSKLKKNNIKQTPYVNTKAK